MNSAGWKAVTAGSSDALALTPRGERPISARAIGTHSDRVLITSRMNLKIQRLKPKSHAREDPMAKTKFRPLHDRVVVRRIDAEEKTKGGIIIPDTAKEKPSQGEIIAVGPGGRDESGKLIPIDLKTGDR